MKKKQKNLMIIVEEKYTHKIGKNSLLHCVYCRTRKKFDPIALSHIRTLILKNIEYILKRLNTKLQETNLIKRIKIKYIGTLKM